MQRMFMVGMVGEGWSANKKKKGNSLVIYTEKKKERRKKKKLSIQVDVIYNCGQEEIKNLILIWW